MQDCNKSSALVMELLQSCTKPLICLIASLCFSGIFRCIIIKIFEGIKFSNGCREDSQMLSCEKIAVFIIWGMILCKNKSLDSNCVFFRPWKMYLYWLNYSLQTSVKLMSCVKMWYLKYMAVGDMLVSIYFDICFRFFFALTSGSVFYLWLREDVTYVMFALIGWDLAQP